MSTPHPAPPRLALILICSIFPILIFSTTFLRLWIRGRNRWSTDDALVTAALPFVILEVLSFWGPSPSSSASRITKIIFWYIGVSSELVQIWFARLAMVYSAIRITPEFATRRTLHFIATLFMLGLLIQIAQKIWDCETQHVGWKHAKRPVCSLRLQSSLVQFIFSVIADIFLIYYPLRALRFMTSAPVLRRRLQYIFCSTVIATIASLLRFAFILSPLTFTPQFVMAASEGLIDLLVCNLPVVLIFAIHILGFSNGLEDTKEAKPPANGNSLRFAVPTRRSMDYPTISIGDARMGSLSIQFPEHDRGDLEMNAVKNSVGISTTEEVELGVLDSRWTIPSIKEEEESVGDGKSSIQSGTFTV